MPLHLPAIRRRTFLAQAAAASCGALVFRSADGATNERVDPDLFAVLNDSHVSENVERAPNGQNISGNLAHVVEYLLALPKRPASVFINGDLAHNKGLPGDYRQLARLIRPLTAAGIDLHLTMGNHDDREVFFEVLAGQRAENPPVASRHTAIVEAAKANFFLLDSLMQTNVAAGDLQGPQLAWLADALDARADRPALVVLHHNPQFKPNGPESKFEWGGLRDSTELFAILAARPQVKAYVHGHIHSWGLGRHGNVHIVNTPAVGYVSNPGTSTTGWTMLRLRDDGMTLTTRTIDGKHPWHDHSHDLSW